MMRWPRISLFDLFAIVTGSAIAAAIEGALWRSLSAHYIRPPLVVDRVTALWCALPIGIGLTALAIRIHASGYCSLFRCRTLGEVNWLILPVHGVTFSVLILIEPNGPIALMFVVASWIWAIAALVDLIWAKVKRQVSTVRWIGDALALIFSHPTLVVIVVGFLS